ncbi:hypothetical protein GOBAR_AA17285 [Gossypium barbadense]|uniref:Uncharacterized protein n=1 Tax=Gossypium barbadense TaxID=3634 RepID=A0A2P5XJ62_GOSBA|nr:hypothetical protein GOBAR_AA17285 [Gossypium barbadense]
MHLTSDHEDYYTCQTSTGTKESLSMIHLMTNRACTVYPARPVATGTYRGTPPGLPEYPVIPILPYNTPYGNLTRYGKYFELIKTNLPSITRGYQAPERTHLNATIRPSSISS